MCHPAQPWLCSAALGFSQPYPQPRWVSFAAPRPRVDCTAGARGTGVNVAAPLLRAEQATSVVPSSVVAEDPGSHFSFAGKAALEGSSSDLEGWKVAHTRQGPSAGVAPFHTWPPAFPQCKAGVRATADNHNHSASLCGNSCFSPCCWSHRPLTGV